MRRTWTHFFLVMAVTAIAAFSGTAWAQLYTGIQAEMATYGTNCNSYKDYAWHVNKVCGRKTSCNYKIDHTVIGDPAFGCAKSFFLKWRCFDKNGYVSIARDEYVPQEASGKTLSLVCP